MPRPSWSRYWLDMASLVATRGTCPRLRVGCVLVKNNRLMASGYNSAPSGQPHCEDVGCQIGHGGGCVRCPHAEESALMQLYPQEIWEMEAFVTHAPCRGCAEKLARMYVKRVVYSQAYRVTDGVEYLRDMGVLVEQM